MLLSLFICANYCVHHRSYALVGCIHMSEFIIKHITILKNFSANNYNKYGVQYYGNNDSCFYVVQRTTSVNDAT